MRPIERGNVSRPIAHEGTDMSRRKVLIGGWDPSKAYNLFAGHTVYAIVLEVPDRELLAGAGGWRSINRIGLPMMPPLFAQYDEDLGNRLNAGRPADDFATWGKVLSKKMAAVVAAYGTAEDSQAYGEKIAHRLLPNMLPY